MTMEDWVLCASKEEQWLGYEGESGVLRFAIELVGEYTDWNFFLDLHHYGSGEKYAFVLLVEDSGVYLEILESFGLRHGNYAAQLRGQRGELRKLSNVIGLFVNQSIASLEGTQEGTGFGAMISIGDTITGEPGTMAEVVNRGSSNRVELCFTIPRGETGEQGKEGATGSAFVYEDFTVEQLAALQGPAGVLPELLDLGGY